MTAKRSRTFAYLLKHHRDVAGLTQEELAGRGETAALMSDRLNGAEVSKEFSGLVFDHTWGDPFFTVEVLKALIERGDPFLWAGHWLSKDMHDFAVPESVSEVILERVSRLRPETRQVLEEASVFGQVFGFDDLMAVVGLGEDDVEEATAALDEALSLARSMPYPYAEAKLSCEYGMLHLREKNLQERGSGSARRWRSSASSRSEEGC